jgi:hypothetical protein
MLGRGALYAVAAVCVAMACSRESHAQADNSQKQALDAITTAADQICAVIKTEGTSQGTKVTGAVTAELSGLAKVLTNLGVNGQLQSDTNQYVGLLQKDLPDALKTSSECKLQVFNKLADLMLS